MFDDARIPTGDKQYSNATCCDVLQESDDAVAARCRDCAVVGAAEEIERTAQDVTVQCGRVAVRGA